MDRLCVLLYSKYSPMSTKLMTALSECPIDLGATVGLNTVCIDNQDVRKRLLKNGKIEISVVPCILIVYRSGGVEKYEGDAAFQWIDEAVSKYSPPPPPPPPQPQAQAPPPPQNQEPPQLYRKNERVKRRPIVEEEEEEEEAEEEEEEEYIPPPKTSRKTKTSQKSKKETSMEDLGFDSFDKKEFVVSEDTIKNSVKGKDLLSTAAAMQKERESDANKTKMKSES
jgi:hypothetical protein